jgi:hypothetical protein
VRRIAGAVLCLEGRDRGFELGRDLDALDRAQAAAHLGAKFFDIWPMCRRRCSPPT